MNVDEKEESQPPRKPLFWDFRQQSIPDQETPQEQLLRQSGFRKMEVPAGKRMEALAKLQSRIEQEEAQSRQLRPAQPRGWWQVAAAVFLGVVLASVALWGLNRQWSTQTYVTNYGEIREVELPDRSVVALNANSTLRFEKNWDRPAAIREVWLEGEAFFSVQKKQAAAGPVKFVVHTKALDVEVLGTRFNVAEQNKQTQVVLESGKVRLNLNKTAPGAAPPAALYMEPGQLVSYSVADQRLIKKEVDPIPYASWKDHKLIFNNTPLADVVSLIERTYGYKVEVEDQKLYQKTITGTIRSDNVDLLLEALSLSFAIEIEKKDNVIIFKNSN